MNCPQCDSELVTSTVGLLCPDCGALHRFYKTGQSNQTTPEPKETPTEKAHSTTASSSNIVKNSLSKRAKAHIKRLVVPELPDPQDASHLLESHLVNQIELPAAAQSTKPTPKNDQPSPVPAALMTPTSSKPIDHRRPLIIFAIIAASVAIGVGIYFLVAKPAKTVENNNPSTAEQAAKRVKASADKTKRDVKRKAEIKEISTALEVYKRDTGAYPIGDKIQATYVLSKANPKYISYINDDPSSTASQRMLYTYRSDGKSYIISAKLENVQDAEAIDGYYIIQSH